MTLVSKIPDQDDDRSDLESEEKNTIICVPLHLRGTCFTRFSFYAANYTTKWYFLRIKRIGQTIFNLNIQTLESVLKATVYYSIHST